MSKTLTDAELERFELAKFNPTKPLATMENVKRRLDAGYVVYNWQFKAFTDAYEKLRTHLERVDSHRQFIGAWALLHRKAIEKYEKEQAEQRRRFLASLRSTVHIAETDDIEEIESNAQS